MKRKIKFRGKCADVWRKGDHLTYANGEAIKQWSGSLSPEYTVEPETVGVFIGAYDKKGKEIFKGDIIKTPDGVLREIFWNEYRLCWDMTTGVDGNKPYGLFSVDLLAKSEVVGNIYDNIELLKKEVVKQSISSDFNDVEEFKAAMKICRNESEFDYMKRYVNTANTYECFSIEVLRMMWTVYCWHHNLRIKDDEYKYDEALLNLYVSIEVHLSVEYEIFYDFMSEFLKGADSND